MDKLNDKQEQYNSIAFVEYEKINPFAGHLMSRHDPYVSKEKQSNNEPCKCRSGLKYKKCCKFK